MKQAWVWLGICLMGACTLKASQPLNSGAVEGRAVFRANGAEGVKVTVLDHKEPSVVATQTTDREGYFSFNLGSGKYRFVAQKPSGNPLHPNPDSLYAYPIRNPVFVPAGETIWVGFQLVPVHSEKTTTFEDPTASSLEGVVLLEDKPVAEAICTLFLSPEDSFRGQGMAFSPPTGADGKFYFDYLPSGEYYLVARKRQAGGGEGPLQEGDWEGYYPLNPISLSPGEKRRVAIEMTQKKELFFQDEVVQVTGTGISGRIIDSDQNPVKGVYAFVYRERDVGKEKPVALSGLTGADGRYLIPLDSGGRYYLGARQLYGDNPQPGEWYGLYQGSPLHDVVVPDQRVIEGLDIVVERILKREP